MSAFLSPLRLEYIDGKKWEVTERFEYRLGSPEGTERVTVPVGFITDFASVPKVFHNILPPTGPYGKAAVIHDMLYQTRLVGWTMESYSYARYVEREEADRIFKEAMEVLGVSSHTIRTMYWGVRLGGWATWNRYRKAEERG